MPTPMRLPGNLKRPWAARRENTNGPAPGPQKTDGVPAKQQKRRISDFSGAFAVCTSFPLHAISMVTVHRYLVNSNFLCPLRAITTPFAYSLHIPHIQLCNLRLAANFHIFLFNHVQSPAPRIAGFPNKNIFIGTAKIPGT